MNEDGKRLIVAATLATASQWLLSWLVGFVPALTATPAMTPLGLLDPVSYLIAGASMALGGWWAGRRFVIVAVVLTLVLWVIILVTLGVVSAPATGASTGETLTAILKFNKLGLVCSLAAAAAGAWLGSLRPRVTAVPAHG